MTLGNPVTPSPAIRAFVVGGEALTLSWDATPGVAYCVEAAEDLQGASWKVVPGDVRAIGDSATKVIPLGSGCQCFFRVRVVTP